ncbi:MAG: Hcp family type VI secretion system effector [Shimia sp.]
MSLLIFLKLDGIKGSAPNEVHKDAIKVIAWNWDMSQTTNPHTGRGGSTGKVAVGDISVAKELDIASPELARCCATAQYIASGELIVTQTSNERQTDALVIEMKDIIIGRYAVQASETGEAVEESFSLRFGKYVMHYTEVTQSGGTGDKGRSGFDIPSNTRL